MEEYATISTNNTPDTQEATESNVVDVIEDNGFRHYPYTTEFTNEADQEVRQTLHLRKPLRQHLVRLAKSSRDKSMDIQKDILVELALPGERDTAQKLFTSYPLLVSAFSDEVFKSVGMGSVSKGK